jgi:diguanylate cyclase (GGDEF)-like protein
VTPRLPAHLRLVVLLGLAGLACAVPNSLPDGTGMQWDELVLGAMATYASWSMFRHARDKEGTAAPPWRVAGVGAALFATAEWLQGCFPGPAFDGFGVDDVLLFAGACSPLVTCGFLALRVSRTRWTALAVDGLMIAFGLFVVAEVVASPGIRPADAPAELRSLVLMYGGYAAVMLGGAGALCTVSTRALRASVNAMMGAVACQAFAAACEGLAIVAPSPLWTAGSDVAVATSLLLCLHAATLAPRRFADRGARAAAPRVSVGGLALVLLGVLALPFALGLSLAEGQPLSPLAEIGCAAVFVLVAVRLVLRIREDGQVTEDLVRNEEDFRDLVEASSDGVAILDAGGVLQFTSPAARHLLGTTLDAEHALTLVDLFSPEDRSRARAALDARDAFHVFLPCEDGQRELEIVCAERGGSGRQVIYLRDVTTRRRRERELERMAYTDHLTGLPNRAVLFQKLSDAAALPGRRSLLVLDLDGFKEVNDQAGHESGDQLLVEVARRLNTVVRGDDLVARLGGDEFAVLVTGTPAEAAEVAQRVVDALGMPHRVGGAAFAVGASVGVAPVGAAGGQAAFREADAALRAAKQAGKGCVRMASAAAPPRAVGSDIALALADDSMRVMFDAASDPDDRLVMVHATAAWEHATLGVISGVELWATAEQQGRTAELQDWLLRTACGQVVDLDDALSVAVSLPNGQVSPSGLAGRVLGALDATALSPSRLMLSFTEETLVTSSAALVPELEAIRAAGVRLCLDNYGMGQSLFGLLARVPLDALRADLSLLAVRENSAQSLKILEAILQITAGFGLTVIAGGIHTAELRESVVAAGVELLHGRALPHGLDHAGLARLLHGAALIP